MIEFILASNNSHKAEEFSKLFDPNLIKVQSSSEKFEVIEDGQSFMENAYKKANVYFEKLKTPVLADDSGLCVEALPDELGIYSARFGGVGLSDRDRANLLIEKMQDEKNRAAYFVCYLCAILSKEEIFFFEGRLKGVIGDVLVGEGGFGYDPVFLPEGLSGESLAQRGDWKSEHSHRARACQEMQKFLRERIRQAR